MWTQADAVALRNFIAQNPRFIIELHERAPEIKGVTVEESAMTGRDHNGYSKIFKVMKQMSQDVLTQTTESNKPI